MTDEAFDMSFGEGFAFDMVVEQLQELESWSRTPGELVRKHIFAPDIHLYVRINPRHCGEGKLLRSLVLADIGIAGHKQGQGVFTRLIRRLEAEAPALNVQAIVIENIGNQRFRDYLERIGYQSTGWGEQTVYKESPYG